MSEPVVSLSKPVAEFVLQIVNSVTLSAGAPDFEEQAAMIVRAQHELSAPTVESED